MLYTRRGGRLSLAVGVILAATMQGVQLLLQTPTTLLLAALFAGIGFSVIPTAAHPFLADESNLQERTYLFSMNAMTWNATEVIGSLIGGLMPGLFGTLLLITHAADLHRTSIFAGAAITLLALIPISMMKPGRRVQPGVEATTVAPSDVVPRTPWRGFIGGGLMVFFLGLTMGATMPFYNVYFSQFHQANAAQVGWLISLSRIAGILSISMLPIVVSRLGKVKTNLLLGIAAAPFLLLLGLPMPLGLTIFPFLLGYALFRANSILFFNLAMEVVSPRMRGTQGSVRVFFNFGGRALAGVLGGFLIVQTGYGGLFTMAAFASVVAGLVAWLFFRHTPVGDVEKNASA